MPIHDWTRVRANRFHDFHQGWTVAIRNALNAGLLPSGYYALTEQHAGAYIADVLTLQTPPPAEESAPASGGLAVAEAAPRVRRKLTASGGLVFFSTNFRRFKLDEAALADYSIRDITRQTIPEDFRNERIHKCWLLVRRA